MADVLNKKQRSYNMSRIHSKNTSPEIALRKRLYLGGLRGYRLHYDVPGQPDVAYPREKVAIFVDGCFWHMCPECFIKPSTRKDFWIKKIRMNANRDRRIDRELSSMGWKVVRFWEHEVKYNLNRCYQKIAITLGKRCGGD